MSSKLNSHQKDHLLEHYRAIGPASLVAALMAAPRKRRENKHLHLSYLPMSLGSRPHQTTE